MPMLSSSHWARKGEGYELLEGGSTECHDCSFSTPTATHNHRHHPSQSFHPLSGFHDGAGKGRRQSLAASTLCLVLRQKRRATALFALFVVLISIYAALWVLFLPPAYVILEPEGYVNTLEKTVREVSLDSSENRKSLLASLKGLQVPSSPPLAAAVPPTSVVPDNIFSSDGLPPPSDWASTWKAKGFRPQFYSDEEADAWVQSEWGGTQVAVAWREMPRMILRADMLRYLLLVVKGGTWSDMDTVPIKHFANWSAGAIPLEEYNQQWHGSYSASLGSNSRGNFNDTLFESMSRQPIRAVVSIEGLPTWCSVGGFLERLRLKPMTRHRSLQFVQWTLHFAPHHPVMIDVIRRILETTDIYRAFKVEMERERRRRSWGDLPSSKSPPWQQQSSISSGPKLASYDAPWESIHRQWVWTMGHWRVGWHPTSIEEWTGPGVWTDSVVSYLYATTGIRPEDLTGIKQPVQVGDIVILPEAGFHPSKSTFAHPLSITRVAHLFRGSWKQTVKDNV